MGFGLATAQVERVVAGRKSIEVARVRITEAGRRALAKMQSHMNGAGLRRMIDATPGNSDD